MIGVPRMMRMGLFEERQFELAVLILNLGRTREPGLSGQRKQQKRAQEEKGSLNKKAKEPVTRKQLG